MRIISIILFFVLLLASLNGQSIEREIITPFGESFIDSEGNELHQTIGEPMVERFESEQILTQGFHQTYEIATSILDASDPAFDIKVYPNPASDWLGIETDYTDDLQVQLTNELGQALYDLKMKSVKEILNISKLPAGNYYLTFRNSGGILNTYAFQKVK